MGKITITSSAYIIHEYNRGDDADLEKLFTIFDNIYYKLTDVALYYDEINRNLYIPKGFDLLNFGKYKYYTVDRINSNKQFKCEINITVPPRDNNQKRMLMYLTGSFSYKYTSQYSQLMVNMPTGTGKTYCTIASLSILDARAIVINYDKGTRDQWITKILEYTTLSQDEVMCLSPKDMISIYEDDNYNPDKIKFYSCTHDTIFECAKKIGWENLNYLFIKMKIAVKVFDESHREVKNIYKTDFYTNVFKTIYLTATPELSDHKLNVIYKLAFTLIPKYGDSLFDETDKEVKAIMFQLNSKISMHDKATLIGVKGLSSTAYCDYAFSSIEKPIFKFIDKAIEIYNKITNNERCIIFVSKIDTCDMVKEYLVVELNIPEDEIGIYHSKIRSKIKDKVLTDSKIIISTRKSLGTAKDLSNLRVLINTETFRSKPELLQMLGRLRNGGYYIEAHDSSIQDCVNQYKTRKRILKDRCSKIIDTKIS